MRLLSVSRRPPIPSRHDAIWRHPKRNCAHRRPGFVRIDTTQHGRGAADWAGAEKRFAARAMMGRIGAPEDIAMRRCFCFTESDWITEQVLTVDSERMDYIGFPAAKYACNWSLPLEFLIRSR